MSSSITLQSDQYVVEFPCLLYFWGYFICSKSSSSCVNYPSLMSSWLLIIFVIGSSVTFRGFPSKSSKCYFHRCIRSSWLAAFSLAFEVLFLLLTSFTVCYAILDCLSSTEPLILLIWFWMYSICSFKYTLVCSFCAFLSFWTLILVEFVLLRWNAVFTLPRFFLTANVSHWTLYLALSLFGILSAAAYMRELGKFSYSSFGVSNSDIYWSESNLFLTVNVNFSLISRLLSRDQS